MEDLNKRELNAQKDKGREGIDERKSDATSDETLSDIEETENDSSLENPREDPGPSPDGLLDEPGELKDAGPM
jgi:hypothetical protein